MTKRFLVTAGNTREMIDRVRDWGNIFTGNTGRNIAEAISARGEVDLLTSNVLHAEEVDSRKSSRLRATTFRSHADLRELLRDHVTKNKYDGIFMTAAVADYAPVDVFSVNERKQLPGGDEQWTVSKVSAGKVKSNFDTIAVMGTRTQKLVDLFRGEWNYRALLVKFKLEVGLSEEELIEVAQASRRASGADYIVANTLDMVSGPTAGAWLLGDSVSQRIPRAELAARLAQLIKAN
jgi:phosphopantothenoylcysteine synthetase/decarboxylase